MIESLVYALWLKKASKQKIINSSGFKIMMAVNIFLYEYDAESGFESKVHNISKLSTNSSDFECTNHVSPLLQEGGGGGATPSRKSHL